VQGDAHYQKPTIVGPKAGGGAYEPAAGPLSFQFQPGPDAEAAARRKNLPDWLRSEIEKRQLKAAGEEGLAQLSTYTLACQRALSSSIRYPPVSGFRLPHSAHIDCSDEDGRHCSIQPVQAINSEHIHMCHWYSQASHSRGSTALPATWQHWQPSAGGF
jgi:hypothetical protein